MIQSVHELRPHAVEFIVARQFGGLRNAAVDYGVVRNDLEVAQINFFYLHVKANM